MNVRKYVPFDLTSRDDTMLQMHAFFLIDLRLTVWKWKFLLPYLYLQLSHNYCSRIEKWAADFNLGPFKPPLQCAGYSVNLKCFGLELASSEFDLCASGWHSAGLRFISALNLGFVSQISVCEVCFSDLRLVPTPQGGTILPLECCCLHHMRSATLFILCSICTKIRCNDDHGNDQMGWCKMIIS